MTTSNIYSTSNSTWYTWTTNSTAVSTTNDSSTWGIWTSGTGATNSAGECVRFVSSQTPEEIEARRVEKERVDKERADANKRAEEILISCLTSEQRKSLEEMKSFVVKSELKKSYRIRRGRSMNVDALGDDGKVLHRLCVIPTLDVPEADQLLAQKLMLEHSESEFLRIANRG